MSYLTEWFNKMEEEVGVEASITELLRLYDSLSRDSRERDPLDALNAVCKSKKSDEVDNALIRIRLENFRRLRYYLQNRYGVLHVDMRLESNAQIGQIYEYVSTKLDRCANTRADMQKLHSYCFEMGSSVEDVIYVLTGAVLHADMSTEDTGNILVNLAGVLCMQGKGTPILHICSDIKPCNYQYSELYNVGRITFNGLDFYSMVETLDDLKISFDKISDEDVTDYFSCTLNSVESCIELAEQYACRAGVAHPLLLKDARLSCHYGENRIMHLISVYAERVTSENDLTLSIIYTLVIQLILRYGKRYKVNPNFYSERREGLSFAEISKLLLYEEG